MSRPSLISIVFVILWSQSFAAQSMEKNLESVYDAQEQRSNVLKPPRYGNNLPGHIHQEWQAINRETTEGIGDENAARAADFSLQLINVFGGSTPGSEHRAMSVWIKTL